MRTKTKVLTLVLCAVLLVAATVLATMAFLTSKDSVKNTFTFGNVAITMDEAAVNPDGTILSDADRVKKNEYHLIPGHTYTKDPTIHVDTESEDCWLFVKLENGLKDIIDETTIEEQMKAEDAWVCIDEVNNIYAYKAIVSKDTDVVVFRNFKIKNDANVSQYGNAMINVIAYAIQADGFTTAEAAWAAAGAALQA